MLRILAPDESFQDNGFSRDLMFLEDVPPDINLPEDLSDLCADIRLYAFAVTQGDITNQNLQPVLFQSAIKRRTCQPQFGCSLGDIAVVFLQHFSD